MRDIYYAGGFIEHYTYDDYNQLTELKTNKISIYTYEYDAEGDRISQKAETKDRFEYGSKYEDTWYDDLQQMEFEEIEDMLQAMDSHTAFDNLRYAIKHRGLCKGNFGQGNVNDSEYRTLSRIENFTSDYLLDKSDENTQVLADNDKINIYGEERIATNQWSKYNYYITGLNESVYTTTETTSWSDNQINIEYTDTGLTDDIDKGYAYNGEAKDVSGLIYLRARYYNPKIGQFVQIDSYTGEAESIASQNRYCYTINNPYKYVDPSGNFSISKIFKTVTQVIKKTITKVLNRNTSNAKKPNSKKKTSNNDGILKKVVRIGTDVIRKDINKRIQAVKKKVPTPCPFSKSLSKEYKSIYSCIFNALGDEGIQHAKKDINIGKFSGEASCLLKYAISILDQIRGYAINIKPSQYRSALGRITSYSKCFKTLGKEFRSKVTRHGKNMYSNITSKKSPYRQVSYYTSYGNKVVHMYKDSKAYKFYTSSLYKNTIAVSTWVVNNQVIFNFLSTLFTAGGIGAIKGLKNGLSSTGKRTVYINPNNPTNYAFAGAGEKVVRIEGPHNYPNPYNFKHINYVTSTGKKVQYKLNDKMEKYL